MLPLKKAFFLGFFYWLRLRCFVLFSKLVLYLVATFSRRCSVASNFTSNICQLRFNHYILFLHILPRVSDHYIYLTFSRKYTYFFRNENIYFFLPGFFARKKKQKRKSQIERLNIKTIRFDQKKVERQSCPLLLD